MIAIIIAIKVIDPASTYSLFLARKLVIFEIVVVSSLDVDSVFAVVVVVVSVVSVVVISCGLLISFTSPKGRLPISKVFSST